MNRGAAAILAGALSVLLVTPAGASSLGASSTATSTDQVAALSLYAGAPSGNDRFGELLVNRGHGWVLDTPPGIATNGGIVVAANGATLATAVVPSQLLGFTAVARSSATASWSPDVTEGAVAPWPTSISSGTSGTTLLLDDGTLVRRSRSGRWSHVDDRGARTAARACGGRLTGVAVSASGTVLARMCEDPRAVPLVTLEGTPLRSSNAAVLGARVLALDPTTSGATVLLRGSQGTCWTATVHDGRLGTATLLGRSDPRHAVLGVARSSRGQVAVLLAGDAHHELLVPGAHGAVEVPSTFTAVAFTPSGTLNLIGLTNHAAHELPTLVTVARLVGGRPVIVQQLGIDVPYGTSN